jgi:hypothetical protein
MPVPVPAAHHELTLIVGVDEADEVAEHDSMLVTQTGPRQDHRRQPGSAMWIAMPVGTSSTCPGTKVSVASMHARRSSPADPGVA